MASSSPSVRGIQQVFDAYQKSRTTFVQSVAELALQPKNIEVLQSCGVLQLLRPLLLDTVPSIQHNAATALGRLANHSAELAEEIVNNDILPQLVYSLNNQNRFYKKAAAYVLRGVAKHNAHLASCVVSSQAVDSLLLCLEEFDPSVKETAAWAIGYIAKHNADLSQAVVDAGCIPLLVLCLQEPEISLKQIAASALSDIAKHSTDLAQSVVDANAIVYLAPLLQSKDNKLKRQVLSCLSQIAKHSVELAELVVAGDIFPGVLERLKDPDVYVQKNTATLLREISKHTPELCRLIVNSGGVVYLVDYIIASDDINKLPGIMTLGFIAACNETLSWTIISAKALPPIVEALKSTNPAVISGSCWSLGQIGRHSAEHANAVAETNALLLLLKICTQSPRTSSSASPRPGSTLPLEQSYEDVIKKAKRALKAIIQKCVKLNALEPLIESPPNIQKYVVQQFAKVLPSDVAARRDFVANGGLAKIQKIQADPGSQLKEHILAINNCYPEEIVRYYSPGFSQQLLDKIEEYDANK